MYFQTDESVRIKATSSNVFMEFGCPGDIINITCSQDGSSNVTITKATYGYNNDYCAKACCISSPLYDCREDMETVNGDFFDFLQFSCDGKPFCSAEFNGYIMDTDCSGNNADYVQIFFDCQPVVEGPVAFDVGELYEDGVATDEVVPYLEVFENFGSHYNLAAYSFVCPTRGIYTFSATILVLDDRLDFVIYRNNQRLSYLRGLAAGMSYNSVVSECNAGDVVWVNSERGGNLEITQSRSIKFSGFLLYRF